MAVENDARIRQLVELAAQDLAGGRAQEATLKIRQAASEAPNHPLVLNEVARQRLQVGDWAAAHDLLQQVVKAEPSNPSCWLNLAAALRGLNKPDEEMAALNEVLSLQPRNLQALFHV
ncbi:MAG TPA: tetratricopeptide repeat protein, partial [Caulobacteraceae bacterium]